MPWVRIDDGFAEHPKVEEVGPMAGFLHIAALCYCNRNLTDGYIPAARVPKLADIPQWKRHVSALVRVGLWLEDEGGYRINNYLEFQPSKAKVEKDREDARKRMAALRAGKKGDRGAETDDPFADSSGEVLEMFGRTGAERSGEVQRPHPDPSDSEKSPPETRTRAAAESTSGGIVMAYEEWVQ